MKFISKSSNLLIVLQQGLPASPLTGTLAKPMVSVRFKDGIAEVNDEAHIEKMLQHNAFGSDFVAAETIGNVDPYAYMREDSEPSHVITEMQYGTPGKVIGNPRKIKFSPEVMKAIQDTAVEMAKSMLPGMVEHTLKVMKDMNDAKAKTDAAQIGASVLDTNTPQGADIASTISQSKKAGRPRKVVASVEETITE